MPDDVPEIDDKKTSSRSILPTASEIRIALVSGKETPISVLEACLDAAEKHEKSVRAWNILDKERARAIAKQLQTLTPDNSLYGIPFGIKDNIDTVDFDTSYGTPIYDQYRPRRDASCVAAMRAAGAIPLGKTVCTEFAHLHPGATRNPWNLNHTPGGSSSGSAASVAAGMVPLALGTQTTGSVIRPAAFCGVVGYKPTFGDFNMAGILPNSPSFDTLGLFSRSVEDLGLVRQSLLDSSVPDVFPASLSGTKIAVVRSPFWNDSCAKSQEMLQNVETFLRAAKATLFEFSHGEIFENIEHAGRVISGYEFARTLSHERRVSLEKLSAVLRNGRMSDGLKTDYNTYICAIKFLEKSRLQLHDFMENTDFLITPAAVGGAPAGLNQTGDSSFNMVWTWLHTPVITLPLSQNDKGLPLGLQMIGRRYEDDRLLNFADSIFREFLK